MSAFIAFVTANAGALLGIFTAAAGLFVLISKLTPTPKDDAIAAGILRFLNLLPTSAARSYDEAKTKAKDGPTKVL